MTYFPNALSTRFGRNRVEYRSNDPLSDDVIARYAPSILAAEAHDSRSQRYAYIPTIDVLNGLRREGFEPFQVAQCRTRREDRREYTKHMIRLRHRSQVERAQHLDSANEIILINSHDGSSSYQMLAGRYRFVCANGLVVGDTFADVRIPHKGDIGVRVIEGAYSVLDSFAVVDEQAEQLGAVVLSDDAQLAFGRAALALRYDEGKAPISEHRVVEPRRKADAGRDLWSTFNRAQENLVRGGQISYDTDRRRRVTTRAVTGIDQGTRLNRALWVLAEEMKKLAT